MILAVGLVNPYPVEKLRTPFSGYGLMVRKSADPGRNRRINSHGVVVIGRCIAAQLGMDIVAAAKDEGSGIGGKADGFSRCAVGTAGGYGEVPGQMGDQLFKKFTAAFIPQVDPVFPCRIFPVTPKVAVFNRRQIDTGSLFQRLAAMYAAAGVKTHIVDRVFRGETVNVCVCHELFCLVAVSFQKVRIPITKALAGILRVI